MAAVPSDISELTDSPASDVQQLRNELAQQAQQQPQLLPSLTPTGLVIDTDTSTCAIRVGPGPQDVMSVGLWLMALQQRNNGAQNERDLVDCLKLVQAQENLTEAIAVPLGGYMFGTTDRPGFILQHNQLTQGPSSDGATHRKLIEDYLSYQHFGSRFIRRFRNDFLATAASKNRILRLRWCSEEFMLQVLRPLAHDTRSFWEELARTCETRFGMTGPRTSPMQFLYGSMVMQLRRRLGWDPKRRGTDATLMLRDINAYLDALDHDNAYGPAGVFNWDFDVEAALNNPAKDVAQLRVQWNSHVRPLYGYEEHTVAGSPVPLIFHRTLFDQAVASACLNQGYHANADTQGAVPSSPATVASTPVGLDVRADGMPLTPQAVPQQMITSNEEQHAWRDFTTLCDSGDDGGTDLPPDANETDEDMRGSSPSIVGHSFSPMRQLSDTDEDVEVPKSDTDSHKHESDEDGDDDDDDIDRHGNDDSASEEEKQSRSGSAEGGSVTPRARRTTTPKPDASTPVTRGGSTSTVRRKRRAPSQKSDDSTIGGRVAKKARDTPRTPRKDYSTQGTPSRSTRSRKSGKSLLRRADVRDVTSMLDTINFLGGVDSDDDDDDDGGASRHSDDFTGDQCPVANPSNLVQAIWDTTQRKVHPDAFSEDDDDKQQRIDTIITSRTKSAMIAAIRQLGTALQAQTNVREKRVVLAYLEGMLDGCKLAT